MFAHFSLFGPWPYFFFNFHHQNTEITMTYRQLSWLGMRVEWYPYAGWQIVTVGKACHALLWNSRWYNSVFLAVTTADFFVVFSAQVQDCRVPLHVVSFNCTTPSTITFLKSLCKTTKGRRVPCMKRLCNWTPQNNSHTSQNSLLVSE